MNNYAKFKRESDHNIDGIMLNAKYNNDLIAKNKYEAFKTIVSQLVDGHDYQQIILNQLIAQERKSTFVFQGYWAIPHLAINAPRYSVYIGWFLSPKGVVFQESTRELINIIFVSVGFQPLMRVTVARAYELLLDAEFRRNFTHNPNNLENIVIEGLMTHPLASSNFDDSAFAHGSKKIRVILTNRLGLHARAASKFIILATGYKSAIRVIRDNRCVNGKNIMSLMMLAAVRGTLLDIEAAGVDANEAVEGLKELVEHKFFENE